MTVQDNQRSPWRRTETLVIGTRFDIGDVAVHPILQFRYPAVPAILLASAELASGDAWYMRAPYTDEQTSALFLDIGGFYLECGDRKVVIDLGIGNDKIRPNPAYLHRRDPWLDDLRELGCRPEDVDIVAFTHLHVDHVGYATTLVDGVYQPTFVNASHVVVESEYRFWLEPDSPPVTAAMSRVGDYLADSVQPIVEAGLVEVAPDNAQLLPGVRMRPAHGHTPGCSVIEVESAGVRAVFSGDVIHHPILMAHPDLQTNYCVDAEHASVARREFLASVVDSDVLVIPAHFVGMRPGRVVSDGESYRFEPLTPAT